MGGRRQNGIVASLLISIFLFSLLSPLVGPVEELNLNDDSTSPTIGQTSTVSIGSYPDGVNDATSITVPSGEAISGIETTTFTVCEPADIRSWATTTSSKDSELPPCTITEPGAEYVRFPASTVIDIFSSYTVGFSTTQVTLSVVPLPGETEIRITSSHSSETEALGDCATTFDAERIKLHKKNAAKNTLPRFIGVNFEMK